MLDLDLGVSLAQPDPEEQGGWQLVEWREAIMGLAWHNVSLPTVVLMQAAFILGQEAVGSNVQINRIRDQ